MIFSKQAAKDKKSSSSKKVHRRVITEMDEPYQNVLPLKPELKKSDKFSSKPKFLDVYSKYIVKDPITQRKNFKIYQNKPHNAEKPLRT
jgi:hypothetical protein